MKKSELIAKVAVLLPFDRILDYRVPPEMEDAVRIGTRVLVPLGARAVTGCVVGIAPPPDRCAQERGAETEAEAPCAYKDIAEILDEEPLFEPADLAFYRWVSEYYFAPLGDVIRTALPVSMNVRTSRVVRLLPSGRRFASSGLFLSRAELEVLRVLAAHGELSLRRLNKLLGRTIRSSVLETLCKKGLIESTAVLSRSGKRPGLRPEATGAGHPTVSAWDPAGTVRPGSPASPHVLTADQEQACLAIRAALRRGEFAPFLLHGVTGSGKTEVYLQVIQEALEMGKQGLVLVPEIALTPQTVRRFSERLCIEVTVLHSGLSPKERLHYWWRIRRGEALVAIGARSAVFAPFRNLGVIVIDEEHDTSYKQEDRVRYHARDVALVRAQHARAVAILGSATPSLESYYNALSGKFTLLELTERVARRPLPHVTIVNMLDPAHRPGPGSAFSPALLGALEAALGEGKQAIVLLNRRGFSHTLVCRDCGFLFRCPNCSVALTYHLAGKRLCCHYCEHHTPAPEHCPQCSSMQIEPVGRGTERVEKELGALLSGARIARMDRDTTRRKGSHETILAAFRRGEIDVLIGTQMIAKGHDIPAVTCVGVISADVSLDLPDFRAAERTFHLLTQVAGRAGRGQWPGKVFIQTLHPENYCISAVQHHDYKLFYSREIAFRKELAYPPFSRMINVRISGSREDQAREAAMRVADTGRGILETHPERYSGTIQVLGPASAPLARLRGQYRFQCFFKGSRARSLHLFTKDLLGDLQSVLSRKGVRVDVDVDPVQVL